MITLEDKQQAAREQGRAYTKALEMMKQMDVFVEVAIEDYIVTLVCEEAEGMYDVQPDGDLQWMIPGMQQNAHLEVVVRDKEDLRFIPELWVSLSLVDASASEVVATRVPFLWHPFLFHYGVNVVVPDTGEYIPKITIERPVFGRHDEDQGKRYKNRVEVTLPSIVITPGRKEYGPE